VSALVAVVGAGIAGLSAAHALARAGRDTMVLERAPRPGGVIVTERLPGGALVEGGPDSFLLADDEIPALARELGLAGRIVHQVEQGSWIWDGAALAPLAEGDAAAVLGIEVRKEDLARGHGSFAGGMGELIDALARAAGPALRLDTPAAGLVPERSGIRVDFADGSHVQTAAAVLAVPAYGAAELVRPISPGAAAALAEIRYAPSLTVTLGYRADQIRRPISGTGFVVTGSAAIPLRACTYVSRKFPGRTPPGEVALRAFLDPEAGVDAHEVLATILDIAGAPLWTRRFAWARGLPVYGQDHARTITQVRDALMSAAPLFIAGAACDGVGVSACVRSGRAAAGELLRALGPARSATR
jgi:protoporphyrinogen oxidase